ncbi:unnamed protein product [Amoebophrya sp. A25]|nr:unnamed protein product [Amoebophrya sp. A25]|eukprot:GSA25T00004046001.1
MLDLQNVRRLAREEGLIEIQYNAINRGVSFRNAEGSRINVWHTTGTVGTYVNHPRLGGSQLFRRDVDMHLLREIFRNPRVHTKLGYHFRDELDRRRRSTSSKSSSRTTTSRASIHGSSPRARSRTPRRCPTNHASTTPRDHISKEHEDVQDEEGAAKAQLEKLKIERADLDAEIASVQSVLDVFEKQRQEEKCKEDERKRAEEEQARLERERIEMEATKERKRIERGKRAIWWTHDKDTSEHMKKNMNSEVSCFAICGGENRVACLLQHDDSRSSSWTSGVPTTLDKFLRSRAMYHPQPTYIAMGSQGRYYCELENGRAQFNGPSSFCDLVHETKRHIRSVAFGPDYDTWFVVFTDGGWEYEGDVPSELDDTIYRKRRGQADLEFVSLGPNDQYFLRCKNGRVFWNITAYISNELNKPEYGGGVRSVLFGDDVDTCFVRGNW